MRSEEASPPGRNIYQKGPEHKPWPNILTNCSGVFAIDASLGIDREDPVGAVLAVAVVPDGLDGEGEAFAGDGAGDHLLLVNVEFDIGDGLAVLEALIDLLDEGGDCLGLLSLDGLVDDVGAEVDGHQLVGGASGVGAGAEGGELEAAVERLADLSLAQVVAGVEGGEDHLLADGVLKVVLDGGGEGEGHNAGGV